MTREEDLIANLLRSSRTVAVIGASPHAGRHSREAVSYLHSAGYEVIPVRPDREPVDGLPTYARLSDSGSSVDVVVIFRRADAAIAHIREAAERRAYAVWLPPGVWTLEASAEARALGLDLIKERCIIETHRHMTGARGESSSGHPGKQGVHIRRRHRRGEDEGVLDPGYEAGGGGGGRAGGGVRAVLDEKKMRSGGH
jgi:hypothetical protein